MLPRMKWKVFTVLRPGNFYRSSQSLSSSPRLLCTSVSIQHTGTHCLNLKLSHQHRTLLETSAVSTTQVNIPPQLISNHGTYHSKFSTLACSTSTLVHATLVPHARTPTTKSQYSTNTPDKEKQAVKLAYSSFHDTHVTPLSGTADHVVILHGAFGSKQNWRGLGKAISRSGRKIIAVDLRNHGDSPHVADMTYVSMAEDVRCLIEDLGLPSVSLVGHSMGGKVAMVLALTRPDLVKNLAVVDVSPNPSPVSNTFYDFATALKDFPFRTLTPSAGLPSLRRAIVNTPEFIDIVPEQRVREFLAGSLIITEEGEVQWKFNIEAIRDNARHIVGWPDVGPCCYPGDVLFIAGALSNYVTPGSMPALRRYFPEARLEQVPQAGHWVHAEKPHEFVAHLVGFLARSPGSS